MLTGRLCHEVLQRWDYRAGKPLKGGTLAGLIRERAQVLAREGGPLPGRLAGEADELLERFLRSKIARRIAGSEILGREVPFIQAEGPRLIRGVMDLVCRDREGVVVYDFKTGRPPEGRARQGELYLRAVKSVLHLQKPRFELILLKEL